MRHLTQTLTGRGLAAVTLGLSLICLLAAGLDNVAHAFAEVKVGSSPLVHWGAALAVELGVVALGLTIAVRARSGKRPLALYGGVLLFVAASIFANYDASLKSLAHEDMSWATVSKLDPWPLMKALLLGGAIPLMVLLVIEALRELALDASAGQRAAQEKPQEPTTNRIQVQEDSWSQEIGAVGAGHQPALAGPSRGTPERMHELTRDDPTITAIELARQLNVARATVYRWRDDLGLRRSNGRWVMR